MEPFTFLLAGGVAVAGLVVALLTRSRFLARSAQVWRRTAEGLGMVVESESPGQLGSPGLRARLGPLVADFRSEKRGKRPGTTITVRGLGHGAGALTVKAEGVGGWIEKKLGMDEIELGVAADAELLIRGDAALAQAVLDADTRTKLVSFLAGRRVDSRGKAVNTRAKLEQGMLLVWVEHSRFRGLDSLDGEVAAVLAPMVDLAQRLTRPDDLAGRLAERLAAGPGREPEAGARLKCLRLLLREFHSHPATAAALRAALEDEVPEIRLEAALALGDQGHGTLCALVEDLEVPDGCAAQALTALGPRLTFERAEATLRRALVVGRSELAKAGLEALGRLGHAKAESLLVSALAHEDFTVALAAVEALGRVGTVAAVPALRHLEGGTYLTNARAARQAVAQIQDRLQGAEVGQLTLADGEGGALSLAEEAEPGRLSLFGESSDEEQDEAPPEAAVERRVEREGSWNP